MWATSMPGQMSREILLALSLVDLLDAKDPGDDSKENLEDTEARNGRRLNPCVIA